MSTAFTRIAADPSAAEQRMLRSLASSTVQEALSRGEAHASFHGYCVSAVLLLRGRPGRSAIALQVSLEGQLLEQSILPLATCQYQVH